MKKLSIVAFGLIALLSGCSDHPSSLVGTWQAGEEGLFTVQMTMKLEDGGKAAFYAGSALANAKETKLEWRVKGDDLHVYLKDKPKDDTAFHIISKSKSNLVVEAPDGKTLNFRRIGTN